MIMTKAALKDIIAPAFWRMIYTKNEAEFDMIWADVKCESLGLDYAIQYKLDDINAAPATVAVLSAEQSNTRPQQQTRCGRFCTPGVQPLFLHGKM